MDAVTWVVVWGFVAIAAGVAGRVIAPRRNRDGSFWAAWCFIVPPLFLLLLVLPRRTQPTPRRPTLDEEDRADTDRSEV
jgi:drug/metabolite transporter (DMT)-like permease